MEEVTESPNEAGLVPFTSTVSMKVPRRIPQHQIEVYFTHAIAGALKGRTLRHVDMKLRVRRRVIPWRCEISLITHASGEAAELEQLSSALTNMAQNAARELNA